VSSYPRHACFDYDFRHVRRARLDSFGSYKIPVSLGFLGHERTCSRPYSSFDLPDIGAPNLIRRPL
jgi:hypothetical protein